MSNMENSLHSLIIPTGQLDDRYSASISASIKAYVLDRSLRSQSDHYTVRDTLIFGYDYFLLIEGRVQFTAIPEYLQDLCQNCIEALGEQYNLGSYKDYSNIIISVYREGYHLQPHIDVDPSSDAIFYFGENVVGVILESDSEGRLYFVEAASEMDAVGKKPLVVLPEQDGLVYLLNGTARRNPYFHGVSTVKKIRISVTFRTVKFK